MRVDVKPAGYFPKPKSLPITDSVMFAMNIWTKWLLVKITI